MPAFLFATERFKNIKAVVGSSSEAVGLFPEGQRFDLVFLDAMHTYEDVKADIERWRPKVRAGGVMAFHDYGHGDFPGVKQAVDEVFGPQVNVVVTLMWMNL
jgi:cephalosporin hydroxylase